MDSDTDPLYINVNDEESSCESHHSNASVVSRSKGSQSDQEEKRKRKKNGEDYNKIPNMIFYKFFFLFRLSLHSGIPSR